MLRIAICDDNYLAVKELEEIISKIPLKDDVIISKEIFNSGLDLLDTLKECEGDSITYTDILILSADMSAPNGKQVAEIIKKNYVNKIRWLIFTSESYENLNELLNCGLDGYIAKPFIEETAKSTILNGIETMSKNEGSFVFTIGKQIHQIDKKDIYYFESLKKHIIIHTKLRNSPFTYTGSLYKVEQMLFYDDFYRCHDSYIVNLHEIQFVDGQEINMKNRDIIVVSRQKKSVLAKKITKAVGGICK